LESNPLGSSARLDLHLTFSHEVPKEFRLCLFDGSAGETAVNSMLLAEVQKSASAWLGRLNSILRDNAPKQTASATPSDRGPGLAAELQILERLFQSGR
jgi:hypothetical protein